MLLQLFPNPKAVTRDFLGQKVLVAWRKIRSGTFLIKIINWLEFQTHESQIVQAVGSPRYLFLLLRVYHVGTPVDSLFCFILVSAFLLVDLLCLCCQKPKEDQNRWTEWNPAKQSRQSTKPSKAQGTRTSTVITTRWWALWRQMRFLVSFWKVSLALFQTMHVMATWSRK